MPFSLPFPTWKNCPRENKCFSRRPNQRFSCQQVEPENLLLLPYLLGSVCESFSLVSKREMCYSPFLGTSIFVLSKQVLLLLLELGSGSGKEPPKAEILFLFSLQSWVHWTHVSVFCTRGFFWYRDEMAWLVKVSTV